ncbi:fumarylacetoacetate hydrolase family protein [Coniochaeta sp. 2T2.1]|nr:fumarylacetoacetate hydrolase family protein [Coniochaeta sp. 2T2.1]
MSAFTRLVRFQSEEDGSSSYFADLGSKTSLPTPGTELRAFRSIEELTGGNAEPKTVTVRSLLAPLPRDGVPIYCVGLNFRRHAKEADVGRFPVLEWWLVLQGLTWHLWAMSSSQSRRILRSLLYYEGELVFVTSKECRDVKPGEAKNYILGYTVGNDRSCRLFQLQKNSGGQFFFAKAFDKFAPIGPTLISPEVFSSNSRPRFITKVNGDTRQDVDLSKDMIFSPEAVLSHMSQGTTIPAGTAVMTGTRAGVGAFRKPKQFLQHGDLVEVEIEGVGTLSNRLNFE